MPSAKSLPAILSQLQPYFTTPMDDSILQRWEIAPASANPSVGVGDMVITENAAVDPSLDSRWAIGANGYGSGNYQSAGTSAALAGIKPVHRTPLTTQRALFNPAPRASANPEGIPSSLGKRRSEAARNGVRALPATGETTRPVAAHHRRR